MASIQRRQGKDGTEAFRVGYRTGGKLRWTPTIATAAGAVEMKDLIERLGPDAALAILERRTGRDTTTTPLLADYLETHLTRLAAHATPGTVADYRRMATRTWIPALGPLPVDAITRDAVAGWVAWQRTQPTRRGGTYSPKSIANAQRLLSSVLQDAVEDELIPRNPAKGAKLPSDHEQAEKVFLTADEFTTIYAHIPGRWQPLVATLYGTGMRWGEATALRVGDVQLTGTTGTITVRQAWKKGAAGVYLGSAKSKRGHRTITIADPLVSLLRSQVADLAPDRLVFTAVEGGRVRAQNFHPRVWRPAVAASGVGKRPDLHSLRHSHVAALIRAGVPLPVIQRRLGHESITTTVDTYGHLAPDAYAGAAEAAAGSLAGALPQLEN